RVLPACPCRCDVVDPQPRRGAPGARPRATARDPRGAPLLPAARGGGYPGGPDPDVPRPRGARRAAPPRRSGAAVRLRLRLQLGLARAALVADRSRPPP